MHFWYSSWLESKKTPLPPQLSREKAPCAKSCRPYTTVPAALRSLHLPVCLPALWVCNSLSPLSLCLSLSLSLSLFIYVFLVHPCLLSPTCGSRVSFFFSSVRLWLRRTMLSHASREGRPCSAVHQRQTTDSQAGSQAHETQSETERDRGRQPGRQPGRQTRQADPGKGVTALSAKTKGARERMDAWGVRERSSAQRTG